MFDGRRALTLSALKRRVLRTDAWSSLLVRVKHPIYSNDPNLVSGDGIYSADDWGRTRAMGAAVYGTDGTQYDSDHEWLGYVFSVERGKVLAALSLADAVDFTQYASVFEIGCGDMPQAFVLKNAFRHLRYRATDFDATTIEKCARLPILSDIDKGVFDVSHDDPRALDGFELLLSWAIEYALDDATLLRILRAAKDRRMPYVMCSVSIAGCLDQIAYVKASWRRERLLAAKKIRMHGWSRSVRWFASLAKTADMKLQILGRHGSYFCLQFIP